MGRLLALDIGERRIGVAVCDAARIVARPLCIVDRKREDALARIAALTQEYQPDALIVGYPYHFDGKISSQAQQVEAFAEALRAIVSVPIVFLDERFTTEEARALMAAAPKRAAIRAHDDAVAAAVLLQRALEEGFRL
ncbi:MAG: Holliday junction resolvase RuvX [Thermoflexales bacterium]|nr:Holliday junction resolvase RuvX [Thermoflexales bacterium]